MKLYHSTKTENIPSIVKNGLRSNGLGIVYLSPTLATARKGDGLAVLEVETGDLKLTAFDDCIKWEVLCWGEIQPENIKVLDPEILKKLGG